MFTLANFHQVAIALIGIFRADRFSVFHTQSACQNAFCRYHSARNEEAVWPVSWKASIDKLPRELFDVFVIADNCTDQTAAIARRHEASVFERFNRNKCSKGYALEWFFAHYFKESSFSHDAAVIFDADNIADPDFLAVMERHYQTGTRMAAGYRDSKNPQDSTIAAANSIFGLFQGRFIHQGRTNLGLPLSSVSGTGFMFALDIIREEGWHTRTITEDNEFTMQAILKGETPVFIREARFYDEQTTTWSEMLRQRWRWSVGTAQTMRLMVPKLLKQIIRGETILLDSLWFYCKFPSLLSSA